jgi:hypothetical protein
VEKKKQPLEDFFEARIGNCQYSAPSYIAHCVYLLWDMSLRSCAKEKTVNLVRTSEEEEKTLVEGDGGMEFGHADHSCISPVRLFGERVRDGTKETEGKV